MADEHELMVWPTVMAVNRGDTPMCADLPPQPLSVGATNQAHEAQPQQLSLGSSDGDHEGQPTQPLNNGPSTPVHRTEPTSVEDFIAGLKLPLEKPLIQSPPLLRVSHVRV